MVDPTYVEGTQVAVAGATIHFDHTILLNGTALNLTGRTVLATLRASWLPAALHASLEDMAVTVDDAPAGGVNWSILEAVSVLLTPWCPSSHVDTALFDLQYHVIEIDYYPQVFRFAVRSAAD